MQPGHGVGHRVVHVGRVVQDVEERASLGVLHDEADVGGLGARPVQLDDVLMLDPRQLAHLDDEGLFVVLGDDVFYCHVGVAPDSLVNDSEAAFAHGLQHEGLRSRS